MGKTVGGKFPEVSQAILSNILILILWVLLIPEFNLNMVFESFEIEPNGTKVLMKPQNSRDWLQMFSILSWNGPEIKVFLSKEVSTFENPSIKPTLGVKTAIIFGSELLL